VGGFSISALDVVQADIGVGGSESGDGVKVVVKEGYKGGGGDVKVLKGAEVKKGVIGGDAGECGVGLVEDGDKGLRGGPEGGKMSKAKGVVDEDEGGNGCEVGGVGVDDLEGDVGLLEPLDGLGELKEGVLKDEDGGEGGGAAKVNDVVSFARLDGAVNEGAVNGCELVNNINNV